MIELLLMLIGAAVLSCWIAYSSTIAQEIKSWFGLDAEQDFNKYKWKYWFIPILFLWVELRALLNCPFCTAYHMGWTIAYFMYDYTLLQSLLIGAITIGFVDLYRKISL